VGDFWSGFGSAGRASSAGSASAGAAGLGQGGVPGIAVATLGLGFAGILATVAFAAAHRRRAEASATAGRNGSIEV
jgi:ABC-type proline/glycine betaine transport system permease subunit